MQAIWGRVWGLCLACVAVVLFGCGQSSEHPKPKPNTIPLPAAKPPVVNTTLLERRTQRPPGVSEQFNYVGGAGPGPCLEERGRPRIEIFPHDFTLRPAPPASGTPDREHVTFGQTVAVCVNDLGLSRVQVTMRGPRGYEMSGVLKGASADRSGGTMAVGYEWVPDLDPSLPLGRYTIEAQSGTTRAATSFTLVPPTSPGLRVLGPSTDPGHNEVAPGSSAKVFIVGFRGLRSIRLNSYRSTAPFGAHAKYFGSQVVPLPATGNTVVELTTSRNDTNASFVLTASTAGKTAVAAFTVVPSHPTPTLVVGKLPKG